MARKVKQVPIQIMVRPSKRKQVKARATRAGYRYVREYLLNLINDDLEKEARQ